MILLYTNTIILMLTECSANGRKLETSNARIYTYRDKKKKKDNKLEYKSGIKSNSVLLENVIVVKNQRAKISISIFDNIRLGLLDTF